MNFYINSLRNIQIPQKQFGFLSPEFTRGLDIDACLVAPGLPPTVHGHDIQPIIESSPMRTDVGTYSYNAIIRNPAMLFTIPSQEEELADGITKETADRYYSERITMFSNFALCFGIGCWLVKDSCVTANQSYWCNLINSYSSFVHRNTDATMSTGEIRGVYLDAQELALSFKYMLEVYARLLPDESAAGFVKPHTENGTQVWDGERAVSTEGKGYSRALIHLQRARSTGFIPEKLDKYCCVLECLYAINKNHKQRISDITAALLGTDSTSRSAIREDMKNAYSIRSDASHGDGLDYLKLFTWEQMVSLCKRVDEYVRQVFRKCFDDPALNYENTDADRIRIRAHYKSVVDGVGP